MTRRNRWLIRFLYGAQGAGLVKLPPNFANQSEDDKMAFAEQEHARLQAAMEDGDEATTRFWKANKSLTSQPQDEAAYRDSETGEEVVTPDDFGGWKKCFQFCIPAGIGDGSWIYSKVKHLRELARKEVILYGAGIDVPHRTGKLIRMLPDVHWGGYLADRDSEVVLSQCVPSFWPACRGADWSILHKPYVLNLSANIHLEAGGLLKDWLPTIPTDYHYEILTTDDDEQTAEIILANLPEPRIMVYVCNRDKDRRSKGGWNLWTEQEWIRFLLDTTKLPGWEGASFLLTGAEYDRDKTEAVAMGLLKAGKRAVTQFEQLGVTICCMRQCDYFFSYPSGIGILANVVRLAGVMLLPSSLAAMEPTYADPADIAAKRYRAWPDPKPSEVLAWCGENMKYGI